MELEPLSGQRQSKESDKAIQAANDFLRLGPGRTLSALLSKYAGLHHITPPTTSIDTLKRWSTAFNWQERAAAFDATWEARKNAERQAELDYGLSLDFERVRKLKNLADFLEAQLFERGADGEYHNVWVPDVKSIGSGEYAERVDIERFNSAIFSEYRATLDDLAKEVGGRIRKAEVSTKDWQDRAVEDIKSGVISVDAFDELARRFDYDLASQLFARAGKPIPVRPDTRQSD